ncbi:MAG: hypothetical protein OHK0046_35810 [Anaerolineae bacterium]
MSGETLSHGLLHHTILKFIIDNGFAPRPDELAALLDKTPAQVMTALHALQDYHGVVLHPGSSDIWVIHPFATAPTNFVVRTEDKMWWGNCAWCSLGVAALLNQDVTITTTLGAEGRQVELHIQNGSIIETDYYVHFPIPMTQAWDNVIYTCSTMLLFENEAAVEQWCAQHRINRGDIQPVENIWRFAQVWYGNHLNPAWEKWTNRQAADIFQQFGLTHPIWHIPTSDARF